MKKILYVTGKMPDNRIINDGGDSTVAEYINALGKDNELDLLLIRTDVDTVNDIPNVRNIIKIKRDMLRRNNFGKTDSSKFTEWISGGEIIAKAVRELEYGYDIIIMQHISCALGLNVNDEKILRKTVLMPMFTGKFYLMAGEYVPDIYIQREKAVLPLIRNILSPGLAEKRVLVDEYGVDECRITVIPRAVRFPYIHREHADKTCTKLLYIGSVRSQKNHIGAVCMMRHLLRYNRNIKLLCCGAIQERSIYETCKAQINEYDLTEHIIFCGNQSSEKIGSIIHGCDINISVSNCETFGRGVYEGMAAGLPTVILSRPYCEVQTDNISVHPLIAADYEDMASIISYLSQNDNAYSIESQKGLILQKELSPELISGRIRSTVTALPEFNS